MVLSVGRRVLWLVLGASFVFLARADEMFASKGGCWDDGHILRRGDVVFFLGSTQLGWTMWGQADRVKVRFRSSKGDQPLTLMRAMATLGQVRRSAETSCMVCVSTAIATWAVSTTTHSPDKTIVGGVGRGADCPRRDRCRDANDVSFFR